MSWKNLMVINSSTRFTTLVIKEFSFFISFLSNLISSLSQQRKLHVGNWKWRPMEIFIPPPHCQNFYHQRFYNKFLRMIFNGPFLWHLWLKRERRTNVGQTSINCHLTVQLSIFHCECIVSHSCHMEWKNVDNCRTSDIYPCSYRTSGLLMLSKLIWLIAEIAHKKLIFFTFKIDC